jgi:hypothetical protein
MVIKPPMRRATQVLLAADAVVLVIAMVNLVRWVS